MSKFVVPKEERERRLSVCHKCRFYNETTQSCGTLIVGRRLKPEELEEAERENIRKHKKKSVRLCGCFLPAKTWLKLEQCPIGKWSIHDITPEEMAELVAFVDALPTYGVVGGDTLEALNNWYNKLTGVRQPLSKCPPCVRQTIIQLRHTITEYKNGLPDAPTTTDATP
jgi:hypothetical protein